MKKFTKQFIPMLVAIAMSCSSSAIAAFAAETSTDASPTVSETDINSASIGGISPQAGSETWNYTGSVMQYVGSFTMTGSNMTPTKTIANNNMCKYLSISAYYNCSYSSKLKVEIVDASSGFVYASGLSSAGTSGNITIGNSSNYNMKGKQVKIRFILYDAYGNYTPSRNCNVSYHYGLSGMLDG